MKTLKIHSISGLVAVLMILLASSVNAQIIQKSSDDYRDQLTRCNNWWECYKQQQSEKDKAEEPTPACPISIPLVTASVVPLVIQLPNLKPTDVDARFYGVTCKLRPRSITSARSMRRALIFGPK